MMSLSSAPATAVSRPLRPAPKPDCPRFCWSGTTFPADRRPRLYAAGLNLSRRCMSCPASVPRRSRAWWKNSMTVLAQRWTGARMHPRSVWSSPQRTMTRMRSSTKTACASAWTHGCPWDSKTFRASWMNWYPARIKAPWMRSGFRKRCFGRSIVSAKATIRWAL